MIGVLEEDRRGNGLYQGMQKLVAGSQGLLRPLALLGFLAQFSGPLIDAHFEFRVFDVLKPPPINAIQRIGGGWGILVDDLLAGVYAAVATQLVARLALPALLG